MRLLLQSVMIFFGTLLAAGLLALGEPSGGHAMTARELRDAGAGAGPRAQHTAWQEPARMAGTVR